MDKKTSKLPWKHPLKRLLMLRYPYEPKTEFYTRIGVTRGYVSRISTNDDAVITTQQWRIIFESAGVKNIALRDWLIFGEDAPDDRIMRLLKRYHGTTMSENEAPDYRLFVNRLNFFRLENDSVNTFCIRLGIQKHIFEQWEYTKTQEIFPSDCRRICSVLGIDYRSPLGEWLMFKTDDPPPAEM